MGNGTLNKLDSFFRRHLLIASFICLSILIHILTLPIHIESYVEVIKKSFFEFIFQIIFLSILNIFPILFISLFLCFSVSFKYTSEPSLTLRQSFYISLISNFVFFFFLNIVFILLKADVAPITSFLIISATSFIYSLLFAIFFSWFGNVPSYIIIFRYKIDIGKYDSAAIVIFLNLLVTTLMCLFSFAHIILHFRM